MEAYHVRTEEQRTPGLLCLSLVAMDSLFIPTHQILMGYAQEDARSGEIRSYPSPSLYSSRLETVVTGRKSYQGEQVLGELIADVNLSEELVNRIKQNYHPPTQKDGCYLVTRLIRLDWDYKGSTKELLYILSAGPVKEKGDNGGKRKKVKERSPKTIPVLQQAPAFI
ncbi:MAG: hypothetical protein V1831_02985 [Candidatus Woesearchaeota archaeon]